MASLKAAIFDMDGLIIDSEPFWRASHVSAVAKHGATITEEDVRQMAGRRADEVVRHWRENYGLAVPNHELETDVVTSVIDNITLNGSELPGVREVIALLESHNILLALASSSPPEVISAVVDRLHLAKHFKVIYSAKHEKFGKPHPDVFLTAAKQLGVEASQCVVFEDAPNGVKAAKAAGMKCIAVPEEANLNQPGPIEKADLIVASLEGLTWPAISNLFSAEERLPG